MTKLQCRSKTASYFKYINTKNSDNTVVLAGFKSISWCSFDAINIFFYNILYFLVLTMVILSFLAIFYSSSGNFLSISKCFLRLL